MFSILFSGRPVTTGYVKTPFDDVDVTRYLLLQYDFRDISSPGLTFVINNMDNSSIYYVMAIKIK